MASVTASKGFLEGQPGLPPKTLVRKDQQKPTQRYTVRNNDVFAPEATICGTSTSEVTAYSPGIRFLPHC